MSIKVSVIVPVYNNQVYVVECLKSLLAQTLSEIEIICINDGSTDASLEIMNRFATQDSRVVVVDKKNEGYGVGINTGLEIAHGKYVTILESDDFADLDMLETLYNYAETFDLDIVRANFTLYWSKKIKNDAFLELFAPYECDRIIDPRNREDQHCFYVQPALWSALYRSDFIRRNSLRLTTTPGAAYQDTAFNFKLWACARRVMFVHKPFVHYRQDNEASSINNAGKVNNICIEYEEIRRWLREERPDLVQSLAPVATKMMCDAYLWNTRRIAEEFRLDFAKQFGLELAEADQKGFIDPELYAPGQLALVKMSITNPQGYVDFAVRGVDPEKGIARYVRKVETLSQVARKEGLRRAKNLIIEKMSDRGEHSINVVDARDAEMASRKAPVFLSEIPEEVKISVVLPVYNTESVLGETLDSILAQSFKDFELICINDGSTDSSLDILEEYARRDKRIRVLSQSNRGVAVARNRGLELARSKYTLILDSDDIFLPNMFEELYDKAEATGADLTVCSSCEYSGDTFQTIATPWALKLNLLPDGDTFSVAQLKDNLFETFMGWPWDRLYRTEALEKANLRFPENLANSEDGVFVYGMLFRANRISVVRDVLIKHRSTRSGSVSNSREKNPECFYSAIELIKKDLSDNPRLFDLLKKSFLNWALDYTIWNISTIRDQKTKRALARKLVTGQYAALELRNHSWSYYNLYGYKMYVKYIRLWLNARGL